MMVFALLTGRIETSFLRAPPLDRQNKQALGEFSCPCVRTFTDALPAAHNATYRQIARLVEA